MPQQKWFLNGQRFTRLLVLSEATIGGNKRWFCRCDCGTELSVEQNRLLRGRAKSCGCIQRERIEAKRKYPAEHRVWQGMVERCTNPNCKSYPRYGGSGVQVFQSWREFPNFIAYIGPRPSPKHQIDRYPNCDGNYEPGNVRWVTSRENNNNKGNNRLLTLNGETKTTQEWGRALGIKGSVIRQRIDRDGMTVEQALRR